MWAIYHQPLNSLIIKSANKHTELRHFDMYCRDVDFLHVEHMYELIHGLQKYANILFWPKSRRGRRTKQFSTNWNTEWTVEEELLGSDPQFLDCQNKIKHKCNLG